ncbi:MAG: D-alanyl-D-alanine carboxypeptidase, partial [uncultured Rubrobacteraceae bacterium]
ETEDASRAWDRDPDPTVSGLAGLPRPGPGRRPAERPQSSRRAEARRRIVGDRRPRDRPLPGRQGTQQAPPHRLDDQGDGRPRRPRRGRQARRGGDRLRGRRLLRRGRLQRSGPLPLRLRQRPGAARSDPRTIRHRRRLRARRAPRGRKRRGVRGLDEPEGEGDEPQEHPLREPGGPRRQRALLERRGPRQDHARGDGVPGVPRDRRQDQHHHHHPGSG